jgi:CII-binding regulator of phage lambda lysogenization HflD
MFGFSKSTNKIMMLDTALQRLADGLPLPLEAASWPAPLNTTVPALALRLTALREHLNALADGQTELTLLPETSGLTGLTTSVNALQRRIEKSSATLTQLGAWLTHIEEGNYSFRIDTKDTANNALLTRVNQLSEQLQQQHQTQHQLMLEATSTESLATALRGELTVHELGELLLSELCRITPALTGTFYLRTAHGAYQRCASYGLSQRHALNQDVIIGEGLLGQAIKENQLMVLHEVPADYLPITSS